MAFEELKQDLIAAEDEMRSYVENSDEYLRHKIFKIIMQHVTGITQLLLIGAGIVFALLFLSFAAGLIMSEALGSYFKGFIIVGSFYVIVGILLYIFRKRLNSHYSRNSPNIILTEI